MKILSNLPSRISDSFHFNNSSHDKTNSPSVKDNEKEVKAKKEQPKELDIKT